MTLCMFLVVYNEAQRVGECIYRIAVKIPVCKQAVNKSVIVTGDFKSAMSEGLASSSFFSLLPCMRSKQG